MKLICLSTAILFLLASCSQDHIKKAFVLSNGKMQIDENDKKTIKLDPGNTHTEQELDFASGDKVVITVQTPNESKTFELPAEGSYVINLKTDTLTGGMVNYGNTGRPTSLSKEQYDQMIDSTRNLIEGKNMSDDKKTYFIPPFTSKKISNSGSVRVIGPYHGIPYSVEADQSGKTPEVYKFFTNKQQRESLDELTKRMSK